LRGAAAAKSSRTTCVLRLEEVVQQGERRPKGHALELPHQIHEGLDADAACERTRCS
jgi:hypothetical protein